MASLFDLLDREWSRLAGDRRAWLRLPDVATAAGGARSLAEVEGYVRAAAPADADRVLVALAAGAVAGDGLAARVLLQLLLPGVRRLARTWWALGDSDERAAAAVAATYARIRRYPLARRPRRIAANVLMDAGADLRRAVRPLAAARRRGSLPLPGEASPRLAVAAPGGDASAAPVHPAVELAATLVEAVERGVVSRGDAELIAASRISGTPLAELATRRGASLRTLQWQRHRAESRLAGAGATIRREPAGVP